MATSKASFVS